MIAPFAAIPPLLVATGIAQPAQRGNGITITIIVMTNISLCCCVHMIAVAAMAFDVRPDEMWVDQEHCVPDLFKPPRLSPNYSSSCLLPYPRSKHSGMKGIEPAHPYESMMAGLINLLDGP